MKKHHTIADITRWAEESLPGEEARARSVIVGCRKADLFTKGGHGRNAPTMNSDDFATAILAVLHPGQVTRVADEVATYRQMPLTMAEIDDPDWGGPLQLEPESIDGHEALRPYFDRFNLPQTGMTDVAGIFSELFSEFAPHRDFFISDRIEIETAGDSVAIRVCLHGGYRIATGGWPGEGPEHSSLTLTFGDLCVSDGRAVKTSRTIGANALNSLSLMAPNLSKAVDISAAPRPISLINQNC